MKPSGLSMTNFLGIYGYSTTRDFSIPGASFRARSNDLTEVRKWMKEKYALHLTAIVKFDEPCDVRERAFDLEAVLVFVQQRNVLIRRFQRDENFNKIDFEHLEPSIDQNYAIYGNGAIIMEEEFARCSRQNFIKASMKKIDSSGSISDESLRLAFFKNVEIYRSARSFIDVEYYLLFSALEALARDRLKNRNPGIADILTKYLKGHGFDVHKANLQCLERSMDSYTKVRDTLFHNGGFEEIKTITDEKSGIEKSVLFRINDYYDKIKRLLPLVLMKEIGFDDGKINWDSWITR